MKRRRKLAPGLPYETKAYVCIHVFEGTRPVLYFTRTDRDWCALCGGYDHAEDASDFRTVGLGHVVDDDPGLADVLHLEPEQAAERTAVGDPWVRVR